MISEMNTFNEKNCRKTFNRIGFAFLAFELVFAGLSYFFSFYFTRHPSDILNNEWVSWLLNYLPMYFIALPAAFLIIKKLPETAPEQHKLSVGKFSILVLIGFGFTIAGSIAGNIFSFIINIITGSNTSNSLNVTLKDTNPLIIIIFAVIMAPLVEEFLCRKLIIDHMLKYGEWTAILLSGLIFGLIHGNFFQFFYAFLLGMLFAFIYTKTGKLRYTIIFHMIINTFGGLIPSLLFRLVDLDFLSSVIADKEYLNYVISHIVQILILFSYVLLEYGIALAGIILFIVFCKKIFKSVKPLNMPKGKLLKCVFLNPGMILFLIAIFADFTLYLFNA